ncbi:MAG: glycosyltransferase family 39 protein [Deltaproteobacteria bacterium]|nr:glycosyltransferase family 39 protein [Deltaproteobacteria bacterium]
MIGPASGSGEAAATWTLMVKVWYANRVRSGTEISFPADSAAERGYVRWGYPVVLTVLWVAMVVAVNPIGDFPLNDDWAWGSSVKKLCEEHVLTIHGWADAAVVAQILWGALFCLPFGFSFTVLRFSTEVLGLATVLATYGLGREVAASRWLAFLCALAVATNPLIFESSNTFMTDVPFLAFLLLAVLCFVHSVRTRSWVTSVLTIPLVLMATMTRQLGLVIPLLFAVGCILSRTLGIRSALVILAAGGLAYFTSQRFEAWLAATGQLSPNYGRLMKLVLMRLRDPSAYQSALTVADGLHIVMIYIGFFCLPLLIALLPLRLRTNLFFTLLGLLAAAAMAWIAWGATHGGQNMPFAPGFNLTDLGLGPMTLPDLQFRHLDNWPRAPFGIWDQVTRAGMAGGVLVVLIAVMSAFELLLRKTVPTAKLTAAVALGFVAGYGVVLLIMPFDRYFVPMFPMILLYSAWGAQAPKMALFRWAWRLLSLVALLGIVAQGVFAVVATHDYLAWNRARWVALRELTDVDGISPDKIDGGFEFNASHHYGTLGHPDKNPWVEDDEYMITLGSVRGYRTLRTYPFQRWLAPPSGQIHVLVRE